MRIAIMLIMGLTTSALAQGQENLERIETILDRLEKRLLEQEQGKSSFLGESADPHGASESSSPVLEFRREVISGNTSEEQRLMEFAQTLTEIEQQVERLGSDVHRIKQNILENARINNKVAIEAALSHPDRAVINSIEVTLDDFKIYNADEASGLFLPLDRLNLFFGPIPPGRHSLAVKARLVMKDRDSIPLTGAVHRNIEQEFTLDVPDGSFRKRWIVQFNLPKDDTGKVTAELKAQTL